MLVLIAVCVCVCVWCVCAHACSQCMCFLSQRLWTYPLPDLTRKAWVGAVRPRPGRTSTHREGSLCLCGWVCRGCFVAGEVVEGGGSGCGRMDSVCLVSTWNLNRSAMRTLSGVGTPLLFCAHVSGRSLGPSGGHGQHAEQPALKEVPTQQTGGRIGRLCPEPASWKSAGQLDAWAAVAVSGSSARPEAETGPGRVQEPSCEALLQEPRPEPRAPWGVRCAECD